jgi:hypothetical protein
MIKRGMKFPHPRVLSCAALSEHVPQTYVVTRVTRDWVYYRADYGLHDDGTPWLGKAECTERDRFERMLVAAKGDPA